MTFDYKRGHLLPKSGKATGLWRRYTSFRFISFEAARPVLAKFGWAWESPISHLRYPDHIVRELCAKHLRSQLRASDLRGHLPEQEVRLAPAFLVCYPFFLKIGDLRGLATRAKTV